MAVIVIKPSPKPEDVWLVARWAFRWLLGHAILEAGSDGDVKLVLERAIALDGLHFHLLKAEEARKTWDLLVRTTRRAVSGDLPKVEVEGRVLDERSQEQFRAAAKELAALLTIRSSDAAS